jgi:membrane-associated protease RseP (regulator of RpoE activity)
MRVHRVLTAVLAFALLAPAAAEAQVTVRVTHRGVLGIMTEVTRTPGATAEHRVIADVVPESPADRAGVMKGDTLVSINGRAVDNRVMATPFEPGDTVVLRVRRDGRERDINVIAEERTGRFETFTFEMLPDSIMRHVAVIMDNVRAELDTLKIHPQRMRIERLPGDSAFIFQFGDDSTRTFRFRRPPPAELDSLRLHFKEFGERSLIFADSLRDQVLRSFDGRIFEYGDSVRIMRPGEIFVSGMSMGLRSVAGAELAELNSGLAEYFGVADGVLVLNARDGTPAARAGLAAGDVIQQINGVNVGSIPELRRAIERAEPRSAVRLRVLRRGQTHELELARE